MIEFLKQWANSLLCVGIFTAIVEMALPKGNIKKYIYVLIGVVTLIVIISPFISSSDYEKMIEDSIEVISKTATFDESSASTYNDYSKYQDSMVKNEYSNNIKKSIWNDLVSKGVSLDSINILLNDDYSISKLDIYVKEYGKEEYKNEEDITGYIKKYYEISEDIVNVINIDGVDIYGK